jgi:hypothetical protein
MIKRYSNVKKWGKSDELHQGDIFLFDDNEFASIAANPEMLDALKKMYFDSGVILAMEGGFESDFSNICKALSCYDPYDGIPPVNHLPGEKPLWIFSGPLPSAAGIVMKLCPSDESMVMVSPENADDEEVKTGFFSDYVQGQVCDLAVDALQKSLEPSAALNSPQDELTNLIAAYKHIVQKSHTIPKADFWNYKVKEDRTNIYQVEFDIYNAFSESEKRNYYYMHVEMMSPFYNTYIGSFHSDMSSKLWNHYKACGFYGNSVQLSSRHGSDHSGIILHQTRPTTTQATTTYTSGVSFNLGGEVSTSGPTISGGISISKSQSYSVADITISALNEISPPTAAWKFALKEPNPSFNPFYYGATDMKAGSLTGRTTFIGGVDFIVSMPQGHNNRWWMSYTVELKMIHAASGAVQYAQYKSANAESFFNLPKVK